MSAGLVPVAEARETSHALSTEGQIVLDETGLHCLGVPSLAEFERVGAMLTRTHRMLSWWIGDWYNAGEQYHGELFAQLLDHAALDPATVTQYAWVARQVPPERRCVALTFSHHREVADLSPDQQYVWLSRAEDAGYSSHRLRRELAKHTRAESRLWVLVAASSPADAEALCSRLIAEGRAAKVVER
jgi:hypothetical protein